MKHVKKLLFLSFIALIISCENQTTNKKLTANDSSGNINSINIIIDNENWNGRVGEAIRDIFAANAEGLPQQEPLFNLKQLPPSTFSGFARNNRTFLKIDIKQEQNFVVAKDTFASPQLGVFISGNKNEVISLLEEKADHLVREFKTTELKEQLRRIKKSQNDDLPLQEKFGISMTFPTAYRYAKEVDGLTWIRKDINNGSMELLIYEAPIASIENDQEVIANIIKLRDSIGKEHIPGPSEGQYMVTEEAYAPFIYDISFRGKKAFEVKGTWEVKNNFMAGPFLLYAIKDEEKQRYLIAEGFVFKPSYAKRNNIFEIEAILKSIDFVNK